MNQKVIAFEGKLLRLLHFVLRRAPVEQVVPIVTTASRAPNTLSPTCLNLVRDALAKGTTLLLARGGGWRRERFLRGEKPVEGRLWERTPPQALGMTFSSETLDFLLWATATNPKQPKDFVWRPDTKAFTLGDQVFLFLAYGAFRDEMLHRDLDLPERPAFRRHALCRLAFAEDFLGATDVPDFQPWVGGEGAWVMEAVQPELGQRWLQTERSKEDIADFEKMRGVGAAQERILGSYLDAVERVGRLDLARFVLIVATLLIRPGVSTQNWVGGLNPVPGQRLADRSETHRAALAFLRQLVRLETWTQRARATGYWDEGYAAAQLWLADWERLGGERSCEQARTILRQLDPIKSSEGVS